jgi:macrolide-specific efflux system membrane fusion protein
MDPAGLRPGRLEVGRVGAVGRRRATSGAAKAVASAAALVGSLVLSGCMLIPAVGVVAHPATVLPEPKEQRLTTVQVQTGDVVRTVQVAGQVQPRQTAYLYFQVGGKIQTLNMRNGQMVRAGDVLATLDPGNLPFQIHQQELTIERDQLHIHDLVQSATLNPPTSAADALQRSFELQQAQLQLEQDQQALRRLQLDLARYQIVAPFSGRIMNVSKHLGDGVGAGEIIAQLQDTSGVRFVAKLTADQARIVAPGQPVVLTLSSQPNDKLTTTVHSVQIPSDAQIAIAKQNNGLGGLSDPQVTLALPSGYTPKIDDIGASFTAIITVAEADNVLYLPKNVVYSLNGLAYVNLYKDGRVVQRPVSLGLEGDQYMVITAGLQDGDTVVQ